MQEIWKDCSELDNLYKVSNLGNVFGPKPWGRIHTAAEISGFLTKAGFVDMVFSDFAPGTYRLVTAKKE